MFVILWEYEVKPGSKNRFQEAYGPDGAWVRLFEHDVHFRGTQLQRDPTRPLFYFTIDFWDSESAYTKFLAEHKAFYAKLDGDFAELTVRERRVVSFHFEPSAASC